VDLPQLRTGLSVAAPLARAQGQLTCSGGSSPDAVALAGTSWAARGARARYSGAVSDPIDPLYALPVREFTAARDRLAATLAASKERDRAREVKALRRPTVAAWVVNQLARRHRPLIERLIDAGEALRRVQQGVVRGSGAGDLRDASKRRQEVLAQLHRLAGSILAESGAAGDLDDILATLEAASVDPRAAEVVTTGRLSRELPRPTGFGEEMSAEPTRSRARDDIRQAARRARELRSEARHLERDATRGAQAASSAARRVAKLDREHREHQRRIDALRTELAAAERRLRDSEVELARARAEQSKASSHAGDLRRVADAARAAARRRDENERR